jgi:predicted ester cyclase
VRRASGHWARPVKRWPSRTATRPSASTRRVSGGATPRRWTRWSLRTSATSGAAIAASKGWSCIVSELRSSYPDLSVSVEDQETEGDLVRTRLTISGTDRGSGVMWCPPTGRHVSFEAELVDRFSGSLLVEHAARADAEGLLRQRGHHGEV